MKPALCILVFWCLALCNAWGQPHDEDDLYVRVVDVGPGLCCVIDMPGDHYMIYDAGLGASAFDDIAEIIPAGSRIDLMVLSHTDADHLGAVTQICDNYEVDRVIRSGMERTSATWNAANQALILESQGDLGGIDINLSQVEFPVGATYRFGDVYVTMVSGFSEPPESWDVSSGAKYNNAGSIVIRVKYNDRAILFCGDAVGRDEGAPEYQCIATEKFMVEMSDVIPINADVIIAPHHGADNANSYAFIDKVRPTYVVFSAGHRYRHPSSAAVHRYLNRGVDEDNIFRTDLGDDEGPDEWSGGRITGSSDPSGDDDIDIIIKRSGHITVSYRED